MSLSLRARSVLALSWRRPATPRYTGVQPFVQRDRRRALTTDSDKPAEPFRVLFCGSDVFSVAALEALLGAEDVWQSIAVMTPRERAVGRGGKDRYTPPLKLFALERDLEHHDVPASGLAFPSAFTKHHPTHLLLTASFGHIIPTPLLQPFAPALTVHPSALPMYRGAAPVQWAIANRDESTGVTVQSMAPREVGVDAGAILGAVDGLPIPKKATYDTLLPDLAHIAGRLLVQVLRQLQSGAATPRAQDPAGVTRAPKITHKLAQINWAAHGAHELDARHRGFGHHQPLWANFPTAKASASPEASEASEAESNGGRGGKNGKRDPLVQLTAVRVPDGLIPQGVSALADQAGSRPGTVVLDRTAGSKNARVLVLTREGWLEVDKVKPAAKKELPAREWWNGLPKDVRQRGWGVFE